MRKKVLLEIRMKKLKLAISKGISRPVLIFGQQLTNKHNIGS